MAPHKETTITKDTRPLGDCGIITWPAHTTSLLSDLTGVAVEDEGTSSYISSIDAWEQWKSLTRLMEQSKSF